MIINYNFGNNFFVYLEEETFVMDRNFRRSVNQRNMCISQTWTFVDNQNSVINLSHY